MSVRARLIRNAAVVGAAAVLLIGCSSSKDDKDKRSSGPTSARSSAPSSSQPTLKADPHLPPAAGNKPALRKQVSQSVCKATTDGWQAGGSVTNTGKADRTFHILVYFSTSAGTVINSATTSVKVPSHGKKSWTASKKFNTEAGMRCVIVKVT